MVDASGGKKLVFNIVDAKSSINANLSSELNTSIRNTLSTQNQKRLYDAIENGTLIQAKPRGARAQAFFNVGSNDDLPNINFTKNIDFFVNDFPASAGYNIFKKTLNL